MADSSPANSIIEGTVKFRDGKKVREKNLINITVFSVEQLTPFGAGKSWLKADIYL